MKKRRRKFLPLVLALALLISNAAASTSVFAEEEHEKESEIQNEKEDEIRETQEEDESTADPEDDLSALQVESMKEEDVVTEDGETDALKEDNDGEEQSQAGTLSYQADDYSITVTYGPEADLPEDVSLSAYEYEQASDTFKSHLEEAAGLCDFTDDEDKERELEARLFNVSLLSDGEEIEPAAAVDVSVSYPDQTGMREYAVVHFGTETEQVEAKSSTVEDTLTVNFSLDGFSDIMVLAYDGSTYDVVFTTSNDNGLAANYAGSLYSGGYNGGSRDAVSGLRLADYAETDGTIEISLPANADLGSAFPIYTDEASGDSVNVTLNNIDSNYNYDLVGWYNLGTGDYYEAGSSAVINLGERNVFYADYYAADYNVGYDNGNLAPSVSTDFVDIKLFDYNELFNLYSTNVASGTNDTGEVFTDSGNFYTMPAALDDENAGHAGSSTGSASFITKYNNIGRSNSDDASYLSNIFYPGNLYDWNEWVGSYNLKDAGSIWGIHSSSYADNAILDKLFNPDTDALGVKYIGDADYLFQYGTEDNGAPEEYQGYYYYSSNLNSAAYNQSAERFYVYNDREVYGDSNMFLPFQDHDSYQQSGAGTDDLNVNYLFGMSMEVDFYLPNAVNGQSAGSDGVGNKDLNGNDLVFSYSGDDDILIFVDDELILDMSGIHLEADGSINFNTGTWEMSNVTAGPSGTIDLKAGSHKLTVYYLERGTGYSNLTVSFNVVPMWHYEAADVQTIEASKVWVDADQNVIEDTADFPDVNVGLYAALGEAELQSDGSYRFEDDEGQVHVFTYTENSYTHTINGAVVESSTEKDADGRFVDENGWVLAWMEDDSLYVRVDVQYLGESNGWSYDWEMRNPAESYVVLELEEKNYTLIKTETDDHVTHYYWSIIGEAEIEDDLENKDLSQIKLILTDGAQQTADTLGDTMEAAGWVLVANPNGTIEVEPVTFSQIGTLTHVDPETEGETGDWYGTYGVTTESEILSLGDGAVWYMEDAGDKQDDTTGEEIETFYLYCELDGTTYYLTVSGDNLAVSATERNEFYYDSLGELRFVRDEGDEGPTRVTIDESGNITLDNATEEAETNDIRIYALTEISEGGHGYTFTNLVPDEPTKSVDVGNRTEAPIGSELTYTIAFFNENTSSAKVTITDVLDEGLDFVSATDGGSYDPDTRTITWVLDDVEELARGSVSFTAVVNENALRKGVIPNTASVQYDNEEAVETNTVENPVPGPKDPVKSVDVGDGTTVAVGDTLVYTIDYYNHYGTPVDVTISDVLDIGIDFVEASDGGTYDESTRTVTWVIENAPALSWSSVNFTVIVNQTALEKGLVENQASVAIAENDPVDTNKVKNPVTETGNPSNPKGNPGPGTGTPGTGTPGTGTNPGPATSGPGTVKTGDTNHIGLWMILMAASAAAFVIGYRKIRRRG